MKNTETRIAKAILKKTIEDKNYVVQDFFVGLTNNPQKRLFLEHKVDKNDGVYAYVEAQSSGEAKEAYNELFKMDMNGVPVRGKADGKYVYCYHINGQTVECPTQG